MQTPILHSNQADAIIWLKDKSGDYNVKAAYRNIAAEHNHVSQPQNTNWHSFWSMKLPPKLQIFGWKCLHNSLSLGNNLLKKHFKIDGTCPFGCDVIETDKHIFLECLISRAAWFISPLGYRSSVINIHSFREWILHSIETYKKGFKDNSIMLKLLWFCWAIYLHRNEVKFKGIEPHPEKIVRIWHKEVSKLNFFEHAAEDLHIPWRDIPHTRHHAVNICDRWTSKDVFIAGQYFKKYGKNIFVAFCFRNNAPYILLYFCEGGPNRILETFFKGFRTFLERCYHIQNLKMNIIPQINFNILGKDCSLAIYKKDILHHLEEFTGNWSLSPQKHNMRIKEFWPWIDSYILGTSCFI